MKETCEKSEGEKKVRALAYFGFAGIVVNINELREVSKVLVGNKGENCFDVFEKTDHETVIKLSQELLTKYFKTAWWFIHLIIINEIIDQ